MKKLLYLVNPHAGASSEQDDTVEQLLSQAYSLSKAGQIQTKDSSQIVAISGGDGSVHRHLPSLKKKNLLLLPSGTGNDLARYLQLPLDAAKVAKHFVEGKLERKKLDLVMIKELEKPFVNTLSLGISEKASSEAKPLKKTIGRAAYAVGAARSFFKFRPFRAMVEVDGEIIYTGKLWYLCVANTGRFGGGAQLEADASDGMMDLYLVKCDQSRKEIIQGFWQLQKGWQGPEHFQGKTVRLILGKRRNAVIDGEIIRCGKTLTLQVLPHALRVYAKPNQPQPKKRKQK